MEEKHDKLVVKALALELIFVVVLCLALLFDKYFLLYIYSMCVWIYLFIKLEKYVWPLLKVADFDTVPGGRMASVLLAFICGAASGVALIYTIDRFFVALPFGYIYLKYVYDLFIQPSTFVRSKKESVASILTVVLGAVLFCVWLIFVVSNP